MVKNFETPEEKEIYLTTIRKKVLSEVDAVANKLINVILDHVSDFSLSLLLQL